MLPEIFVAEDDLIWMTSAVGVPKSCVKAFFAQGIYLYQFDEPPEAIIEVLDRHFVQVEDGPDEWGATPEERRELNYLFRVAYEELRGWPPR